MCCMKSVSVVIPLIPHHDYELRRLFRELSDDANLIKEVIICRSETWKSFSKLVTRRYLKWANEVGLDSEIIMSNVREVAADGVNRNRGWKIAKGEFIVFLDADDSYSKHRVSAVIETLQESGSDMLLHNYSLEGEDLAEIPTKYNVLPFSRLKSQNFSSPIEMLRPIRDEFGNEVQIHHAHISIRNSINTRKIEFLDLFPGADTDFCKRMVASENECIYSPLKLSKWSRKRTFRYKVRLFRKKIKRVLLSRYTGVFRRT